MSKPQTRFVLDDNERVYLRWIAKTMLLIDHETEHEAARLLLRKSIHEIRNQRIDVDPSLEDIRRLLADNNL